VIGSIQATETVKLILGKGTTLSGRLLLYDALNMKFRELKLRRNPECPVCGDNPTVKELIDYQEFCGIPQQKAAEAQEQGKCQTTPLNRKRGWTAATISSSSTYASTEIHRQDRRLDIIPPRSPNASTNSIRPPTSSSIARWRTHAKAQGILKEMGFRG
jgi:hypothetical protein